MFSLSYGARFAATGISSSFTRPSFESREKVSLNRGDISRLLILLNLFAQLVGVPGPEKVSRPATHCRQRNKTRII
jgi:hypothetical protein